MFSISNKCDRLLMVFKFRFFLSSALLLLVQSQAWASYQSILAQPKKYSWEPFICNTGIAHPLRDGLVCRNKQTDNICLPEQAQCICQNITMANVHDFMLVTSRSDSNQLRTWNIGVNGSGWTTAYPESGDLFQNAPIAEIKMQFDSEHFGTQYFIDICFPKNYIYSRDPSGHRLVSQVSSLISTGGNSYTEFSKLQYNFQIAAQNPCQLSGSSSGSMQGSLIENTWNQKETDACVVRYQFNETTKIERSWVSNNSTFKVKNRPPESLCVQPVNFWKGNYSHPAWSELSYEGANKTFLASDFSWEEIFEYRKRTKSWERSFLDLAREWMTSKLNYLNSVSLKPIFDKFNECESFLQQYSATFGQDINLNFPSSKASQCMSDLSRYNDGELEPKSCN